MSQSKGYILALDQGTTSSRAIIFDHSGRRVNTAQQEFKQIFPKQGWVEQDPYDILNSQLEVAKKSVNSVGAEHIKAIGITNQRETTILWDKTTGKPVHNAIVWQDRRTAEYCDQLKRDGYENLLQEKTGLLSDAYFSATKIKWMIDNVPEAKTLMEQKKLAFGTVDSWLIWNLSGGKDHVIDITNASRTLLMNIKTGNWDEELLDLFQLDSSILPEIKACSGEISKTTKSIFGTEIPITGVAGDQQAATFGQMCVERGMTKNTYGTGCFILMNTGDQLIHSKHRLISTIAWQLDGSITYALEGSIFMGGATVQWIRDGLKLIKQSGDIEALANSVEDNGGVYLVPAFTGLGAPHWDAYARGTIIGLTRGTTDGHIARATLEAIAFQSKDVIDAMQSDSGITISELRVDGGAAVNSSLMQFQSDLLSCKVLRPSIHETTALGASYLAGLGVGYWDSVNELKQLWQCEADFSPKQSDANRALLKNWKRALELSKGWANS